MKTKQKIEELENEVEKLKIEIALLKAQIQNIPYYIPIPQPYTTPYWDKLPIIVCENK